MGDAGFEPGTSAQKSTTFTVFHWHLVGNGHAGHQGHSFLHLRFSSSSQHLHIHNPRQKSNEVLVADLERDCQVVFALLLLAPSPLISSILASPGHPDVFDVHVVFTLSPPSSPTPTPPPLSDFPTTATAQLHPGLPGPS